MPHTAIIAQARLESTRFPNKVMEKVRDKTILAHVLERCLAVENADVVCCAIPDNTANDVVAKEAERIGAQVFRGAEEDVLDRYYQAARMLKADVVMRITSDCPLIDPDICADVIDLRAHRGLDFATNNIPVVWPHGLDCEVFTFDLLEKTATLDKRDWAREHVTDWMRLGESVNRASLPGPGGDLVYQRWTVDYPEDIEFMQALYQKLPADVEMPQFDLIARTLAENPTLLNINKKYWEDYRDPDKLPEHDAVRMSKQGAGL
jgi:spore coat polysaccharide biosynthesis protein SpsF